MFEHEDQFPDASLPGMQLILVHDHGVRRTAASQPLQIPVRQPQCVLIVHQETKWWGNGSERGSQMITMQFGLRSFVH